MSIAQDFFDHQMQKATFEMDMDEAGIEFNDIWWDYYDASLELGEVPSDFRLNEAQQKMIFDAGFHRVYVNHKDKSETHYYWGPPGTEFVASKSVWHGRRKNLELKGKTDE